MSKHSYFRLKITVSCRLCAYQIIRVCVCVVYVSCRVFGVCGVCGAAWHAEKPVCRFKTLPCVPAKRSFCWYTRKRFEPTHGDVLNLHTERRWEVFFSLSRPFSLSLLLSLLPLLFLFSSLLFSSLSLFSLSNNDNDHSSSRLVEYTRL